MLKNRSLHVRMVKDSDIEESPPLDYHDVAKVVTKSVSTCICVYVGADILRRIVVYAITTKF